MGSTKCSAGVQLNVSKQDNGNSISSDRTEISKVKVNEFDFDIHLDINEVDKIGEIDEVDKIDEIDEIDEIDDKNKDDNCDTSNENGSSSNADDYNYPCECGYACNGKGGSKSNIMLKSCISRQERKQIAIWNQENKHSTPNDITQKENGSKKKKSKKSISIKIPKKTVSNKNKSSNKIEEKSELVWLCSSGKCDYKTENKSEQKKEQKKEEKDGKGDKSEKKSNSDKKGEKEMKNGKKKCFEFGCLEDWGLTEEDILSHMTYKSQSERPQFQFEIPDCPAREALVALSKTIYLILFLFVFVFFVLFFFVYPCTKNIKKKTTQQPIYNKQY